MDAGEDEAPGEDEDPGFSADFGGCRGTARLIGLGMSAELMDVRGTPRPIGLGMSAELMDVAAALELSFLNLSRPVSSVHVCVYTHVNDMVD